MFPDFGTPLRDWANAALDTLIIEHGDAFDAVSDALLWVFLQVEGPIRALPPWLVLAATALAAYGASRRLWPTLLAPAGLWFIGTLGVWDEAMQSFAIVLVSVIFCAIAGVPLGIAMAKSQRVRSAISPLLDLMQTIPSFVYLIPVAMLLGLGKVPAILATIIYALPPLARLTELGLRQIEPELLEAADAFGATAAQRLTSVELPLAVPSILQGVNQTTMMALAMVVVASMIGAPGLGQTVLEGLQRADVGTGLIGGTAIVILAIVLDRITQAFGARKLAGGQETAP